MSRRLPASVALITAVGGTLAVVPSAPAAQLRPATGGAELQLRGSGWNVLRAQGVSAVAIDPATLRRGRLALPARDARITSTARVRHDGVVQFRARRGGTTRRVNLTAFETRVGRYATTSARVGDERVDLFRTSGRRPATSRARGRTTARADVRLTAAGARLLRQRLGLRRVSRATLGRVAMSAVMAPTGSGGAGTGAGGAGSIAPGAVPPPLAPVTGGVPVTATAMTWRPRESWIRYISTGEGTTPSAGASSGPREVRSGSSTALVYSFPHTPRPGTRAADGAMTLPFGGAVRYLYASRGIDLSLVDPTITLRGGTGTLSAVYDGPTAGSARGSRIDMLSLNLGAVTPSTANGVTTYADVPAVLTAAGSAAFQGFYAAGDEWGTVTVAVPAG